MSLFKRRESKVNLSLTHDEVHITMLGLIQLRNKLLEEGRYTDAVDELLIRLYQNH